MSNKLIPRFCENCTNLLDVYNIESLTTHCLKCYKVNKISNTDRTIATMTYGSAARVIQPSEMVRLSKLPTTQRIEKECKNCKFGIMALTVDENYNCNYTCIKCHTVHE